MPCQLRLMARTQQQVVVQAGVSKNRGAKPIGVSGEYYWDNGKEKGNYYIIFKIGIIYVYIYICIGVI